MPALLAGLAVLLQVAYPLVHGQARDRLTVVTVAVFFLASTTREIQAVAAVDGRTLAAAPGPRTREAQEAFAETLGRELREL